MGSSSKGSSGGSKVHDYYGTIAGIVGEGVFDYLSTIQVDGKTVWPVAKPWTTGLNVLLNELRHYAGRTWICILAHNPSSAANVPFVGSTFWQIYKLERGVDVATTITVEGYGNITIQWGTSSQVQDPKLAAAGNQYGEDHPDYRGICYFVLKNFLFGRERNSAPNVTVIMGRKPKQSIVTGSVANLNDGQAKVIAIGAELLTSYNALALDSSTIDSTSFQATAEALADSNISCSALLDEQGQMRQWSDILSEQSGAWLRFNPSTQKIEAGYWRRGEPPASYHTVLTQHLTEKPEFDGEGWDAAKTRAFVTFHDRARLYKRSSDKFDDARAYRVLGEHRSTTIDRPFIVRAAAALKQAAEWLRSNGRPQLKGSLSIRREHARDIRPGDYILTDIDLEPGGATLSQFFRVLSRDIPFKGPIKFTIDADETLAAAYSDVTDDDKTDLDESVEAIVNARIIEAPVSLAEYQANHILALVERPHETISGFQIYFDIDTGGTFQIIGDSHGFSTRGVLRSDFSDSETGDMEVTFADQVDIDRLTENVSDLKASDDQLLAILVDVASGFVDEDSADYAIIEICSISAITLVSGDDYDLTVLRARQGTQQRGFVTGTAEVWIVPRSSLLAFTHQQLADIRRNRIIGDTPDTGFVRLAPYTTSDSRDLADCSSIEFRLPKASTSGPVLDLALPLTDPVQWPPDWDAVTAYVPGEWVWESGVAYECVASNTNQVPPNITYWQTGNPYPVDIIFNGEWTDPNADIVAFQMWVEQDGVDGEVLDEDDSFGPVDSYSFREEFHLAESGTWRVRLVATDAVGLKSERTITVVGMDSNTQVAKPKFKYEKGRKLKGEEWNAYGKIKLTCSTPGADIEFRYAIAEDRDYADGDTYALKDKRWNNGAIYTCYVGYTSAAADGFEPGVGVNWTNKWKTSTATVAWVDGTPYSAGDKVTNNGVGYFCWSAHTAVAANNEPGVASGWKNRWIYADEILSDTSWDGLGQWHAYDDDTEGFDTQPYGWQPTDDDHRQYIEARATKGGYTDSETNRLDIRFKRIGVGDDMP